jgi:hypothetical protein
MRGSWFTVVGASDTSAGRSISSPPVEAGEVDEVGRSVAGGSSSDGEALRRFAAVVCSMVRKSSLASAIA